MNQNSLQGNQIPVSQSSTSQAEPVVWSIDSNNAAPKVVKNFIFRSRVTKKVALAVLLLLLLPVGYGITNYLRSGSKSAGSSAPVATSNQGASPQTSDPSAINSTPSASSTDSDSSSSITPPTTPSATTPSTQTTKTYCGVSGMPEGVCTAITSIEKDGLKGNQYVTQDTSQVPEGSTVMVDKNSWKVGSDTTGTVAFAAVIGGKNYKGLGTFQVISSTWKVTAYTLQ